MQIRSRSGPEGLRECGAGRGVPRPIGTTIERYRIDTAYPSCGGPLSQGVRGSRDPAMGKFQRWLVLQRGAQAARVNCKSSNKR